MTVSVYHYFRSIDDESLYQEFKKAIPELTVDDTERLKQKHQLEKEVLTQKIPDQFKEKLETLESKMIEMEYQSAHKEYLYLDGIFKSELDDLTPEKLKKTFPLCMIDDWNKACETLKMPEKQIEIGKSERTMSEIKHIKDFKKMVAELKKQGFHEDLIKEIIGNGKDRAKDYGLVY